MPKDSSKDQADKKSAECIKIAKDGPYLVSGNLPITKEIIVCDEDNNPLSWKKGEPCGNNDCALCRCGQSKNKPFCDGSHIKIGFNGTETANRKKHAEQAQQIIGPELILSDAPDLCAGAGFCHRLGGTWDLTQNSDNPKSKETAIQQACDCPSGRLIALDKKTGKPIEPKFKKSLGLMEDTSNKVSGPIMVRGGISLESSNGTKYEIRNRMTLCRCGQSKNKPFCDGSHIDCKFNDGDKSVN